MEMGNTLYKLNEYYVLAKKRKDEIESKYADAISLTFPSNNLFYELENETVNQADNSVQIFDDITVDCAETLANQMELSLTRAGDQWAGFAIDSEDENMDNKKIIDEKNKEIFKHINGSNLQKNISFVYKDLIIGTSSIKIFTIGDGKKKKLKYKHINLGRSYILEDGLNEVNRVFYKIKDFTISKINSMLGKRITEKSPNTKFYDERGVEIEFDIIECAIPSKESGKWDYFIIDEGFSEIFFQTTLPINPFVTVRFNKKNDVGPYGTGKAVERLSLMRSIQFYSKIRMKVIANDSRPHYIVKSSDLETPDISFNPEEVTFVNKDFDIQGLFTQVDLNSLNLIISELEAKLKQAFLVDEILETQANNTYKTA